MGIVFSRRRKPYWNAFINSDLTRGDDQVENIMDSPFKVVSKPSGKVIRFVEERKSINVVSLQPDFLIHYGVKGMKWGVRRTPEQLGHEKTIQAEDTLRSRKGFSINGSKIINFMLKPGAKHANDFFSVGYSLKEGKRLFRDIEKEYDISKATDFLFEGPRQKFSIFMQLGISSTKRFRTVWMTDTEDSPPRLITAYREDE